MEGPALPLCATCQDVTVWLMSASDNRSVYGGQTSIAVYAWSASGDRISPGTVAPRSPCWVHRPDPEFEACQLDRERERDEDGVELGWGQPRS